MTHKMKCDRCKKEFLMPFRRQTTYDIRFNTNKFAPGQVYLILCDECNAKLEEFIENIKEAE